MHGRHRRCASQQANALFSVLRLGLADKRAQDLVERLLHWQWPDGGWPADKRYYRVSEKPGSPVEIVDWGGASKRKTNEWVTVDALYVLREAGRIEA